LKDYENNHLLDGLNIVTHSRPFLKWAGGKFQIIEKIRTNLPNASRLIEPFDEVRI
jgi:hypothetical protein